MIKINVLRGMAEQREYDLVQAAAELFMAARSVGSFSERNPELGKMINCPVCCLRHRAAKVCVPVYAKSKTETVLDEKGNEVPAPLVVQQLTRKGVYGAAAFARQRILKHRNKWGLRVLERAGQIYSKEMSYFPGVAVDAEESTDEEKKLNQDFRDKIGKQSLSRALNELRAARKDRRRTLYLITRESRRINR